MDKISLEPRGLVKRLVGEKLVFRLTLGEEYLYQVQLYTNVNRDPKNHAFVRRGRVYKCYLELKKSGFYNWQIRFRRRGQKTWKWLRDGEGKKITGNIQVDPEWVAEAIVYNVFVRFFQGKTKHDDELIRPGEGGTFDDVKAHLDELKRLGVNTLYFNPIHLIGELHRKYNMHDQLPIYLQPGSPYSIKDFKSIDPELTFDKDTKKHLLADPQQEYKDLINAAHERGMYIIMDLVFNHTAHDFIWQRIRPEWYLYKENITSLEDPYLYPEDMKRGKPWGDPKHTMSPYDHGLWWTDAAKLNWEYRIPEGPNKPPKNTSLKEMWEYFKSIPKYWIRHFGVDGFRCDIAYGVPANFWRGCIADARLEAHEAKNNLLGDVVFIAEAYTNDLKMLQEAGFAAVYGDYSNKLSLPIQLKGYLDYMYNLDGNHFPDGSKWFIFPESHDFGRTPEKVLGENASNLETAFKVNKSRWLLTATLKGIPLIFNGFEKIEWQPINLFSYGAVDWERDKDLRDFIAKVNAIRNRSKALQWGDYEYLSSNQGLDDKTQIFSFLRKHEGEVVIVVVNMDAEHNAGPAEIELPSSFAGNYKLRDLLTGEVYERTGRNLLVLLESGGAHIFKVKME